MCERVALPGGGFAIICGGRHRHRAACRHCGFASTKLCDHRVGITSTGKHLTCDAPICDDCALHVPGKNRDYCKFHAKHDQAEVPSLLPFEEPA